LRIGINGFGRIGRNFTKALLERHPGVEIAAVNDLTSPAECAHLFKYDSNYGTFAGDVKATDGGIEIDGKPLRVFAERDPGKIPWQQLGIDVVVESTGIFTDASKARAHIDGGGAKKVIISAPAKGEDSASITMPTIPPSTTSSRTRRARPIASRPRSSPSWTTSVGSRVS
jgi:glyceraldehyde 3-phosphate dehydrogenase